jgi:hypothetical protein
LIKSGSTVDVKGDRFDQPPLFSAVANGHVEIAALLTRSVTMWSAEIRSLRPWWLRFYMSIRRWRSAIRNYSKAPCRSLR